MSQNAHPEFAPADEAQRANYNAAGTASAPCGTALDEWGSVTMKPGSTIDQTDLQRSAFADPGNVRAAGGCGTRQWAQPVPANDTPFGLIVRETCTLHTDGTGVQVSVVHKNSQAAWAGFKCRDIITQINNIRVTCTKDFYAAYDQFTQKEPMNITYHRDGAKAIITITDFVAAE